MLTIEDVNIVFKSTLDISYKDTLERIFFFNQRQHIYRDRINQSIDEFSMPVLKNQGKQVAIVFKEEWMGQTLHILDSESPGAELIGIVIYTRNAQDMITIVHFVLHEACNTILKNDNLNIALVIFEELFKVFKRIRGVNKVQLYYTGKVFNIRSENKVSVPFEKAI